MCHILALELLLIQFLWVFQRAFKASEFLFRAGPAAYFLTPDLDDNGAQVINGAFPFPSL